MPEPVMQATAWQEICMHAADEGALIWQQCHLLLQDASCKMPFERLLLVQP